MIGERIRTLRLARGWTQAELVARMGSIVTKQAISKYESGKAFPSPTVIRHLASALGVQPARLLTEPDIAIRVIAFRKKASLGAHQARRIEAAASEELRERVDLQDRLGLPTEPAIPVRQYPVASLPEAQVAAAALRSDWALGNDPIANLTSMLEDHFVHVLLLPEDDACDGLALEALQDGQLRAVAIGIHPERSGERQRLSLAHELGHLVLAPTAGVQEEDAAFVFGKAFLAPPATVRELVGARRSSVSLQELAALKARFGISLQAAARWLWELGIISRRHYQDWCIRINQQGWRQKEPDELPVEKPQWRELAQARAEQEGLGSPEAYRTPALGAAPSTDLASARRALLSLPPSQRRAVLAQQACEISATYDLDQSWRDTQGGDIVDEDDDLA
ncbi:MAG: XRE family transcriptional regulator [Anaerolineales bacterium]